ncbi:MAG: GNAT family N-acetyltransferase [Ignavibacteriae bacterium]|nr:GNAT family N-acetyltransferase [Ignavibacteriota bacterium]
MNKPPPYSFVTKRLEIRACKQEDSVCLFNNYTSNISASEYLQRPPHVTLDQTEQFIEKWGDANWTDKNDKFAWSIFIKGNSDVIGLFLIHFHDLQVEIHYGLSPKHWSKGYVTEAGLTILEWLRNETSIQRAYTICDIEHKKSISILSKLGLQINDSLEYYLSLPNKDNRKRLAALYEIYFKRSKINKR